MSTDGAFDEIKGKAKETAGEVTDDEDLEREGKVDQATGKVKEKTSDAAEKVGDKVNDWTDKDK